MEGVKNSTEEVKEVAQSVLDDPSLLLGRPASFIDGAYTRMYLPDAGGKPGCDIWVRTAAACTHAMFLSQCTHGAPKVLQHLVPVLHPCTQRPAVQAYRHPNGLCVFGLVATHTIFRSLLDPNAPPAAEPAATIRTTYFKVRRLSASMALC